jgi:hypothetical protein
VQDLSNCKVMYSHSTRTANCLQRTRKPIKSLSGLRPLEDTRQPLPPSTTLANESRAGLSSPIPRWAGGRVYFRIDEPDPLPE